MMSVNFYVEREIDPTEPHNAKFKSEIELTDFSKAKIKRFIEKQECLICGATEETKICSRTFGE